MRYTFVPGNCLIVSLVLVLSHFAPAQNKELTADESIPIPKAELDAQGELKITASPNSSPNDFDFLVGKMENAQPTPGQTAGQLPRLDRVRFLGREYEDSQRCSRHGYILDHAVSRNGRQTFRRSHLAIIRPEDTTLESLLDREQHGKDRSSRRWFVRSKWRRPFFWQRYAQ